MISKPQLEVTACGSCLCCICWQKISKSYGGEVPPPLKNVYYSPKPVFEEQSDDVPAVGTSESAAVVEETTATLSFLEKPNGYSVGFSANLPSASYADATPNVSLADFLSRPVKISTTTWSSSDGSGSNYAINPWQLFFSSPAIQNKLVNYAWLKCDLKIKIMVNASPFYFGAQLASYAPLPSFHGTSITPDAGTRFIIPYSQRPHVWIYPQNNEGGEMTLPFIWPKNWISTISNQDFLDMGQLTFLTVVPLDSANGVVGSGVSVTVYAWAENVVLSGPTTGLLMQSDEYGRGSVSSVASAVATAAKALGSIPIIRPFATATQMGASAVAAVASSLGYCNTPVIEDTRPLKPSPLPVLASTEQGFPIEKLTVDPKNELSVDPAIIGLPAHDELTISGLVARESYLTNFAWSSASANDTLLFSTVITPLMYDRDSLTSPKMYLTPVGWLSQPFTFWRGDIILRFRFICTQYHRGRVRITFDPSGSAAQNILNTVNTQTTCFNEVVDLTKDTNVEVRVPYNQATAWLRTPALFPTALVPFSVGASTTFNHLEGVSNGTLAVRVVTAVTAPVALSIISCVVSVRGADNLEFAGPRDINNLLSPFATQSDEYEETPSQLVVAGHAPAAADPHRYLINHGEQVVSLRQLVRRYQYSRMSQVSSAAFPNVMYQETFNRIPPYFGYDPSGIHLAKGLLVPATTFPFNYTNTTYLQWVAMCFLGYRGSVNYSLNAEAAVPLKHFMVSRVPNAGLNVPILSTLAIATVSAANQFYLSGLGTATGGGSGLTNQLTNACINVANPMYSAYKMNRTTPSASTVSNGLDDSESQVCKLTCIQGSTQPAKVYWFTAAGTDWSPHFFLNVPTLWNYSASPVAV